MFYVFISLFSLRTGVKKSFFCFLARKKRDEKSEKSSSGQCFLSLFAKNFFSSEKMNASAEKANEKKAEDRSNDNVTEKSPIISLAVPKKVQEEPRV